MKILLVGGSGFVGSYLARHLLDKGHQVTIGSRQASGPLKARYASINAATGEGLEDTLSGKGFDAVMYLVGIIREQVSQNFDQAHVLGVYNTLKAAEAAGVKRFVHMSALGASKGTGSRYFETKAEGESMVQSSKLDWTILRPSLIFGIGDDFFGRVLKGLVQAPAPFIPLIGDGQFPFRPIWIGDVATAFEQCLQRPQTLHRSYNLVGPQEYSFRKLLWLVRSSLGSSKPIVSIPLWLMDLAVPIMSALPFSPLTRDQYLMLKAGNSAEPHNMLQAFDLPQRSLEVELPAILTTKRLVGA